MGLDSISFLDFDEGWEQTTSRMRALPLGKPHLPETSADGASESSPGGGYAITFYHEDAAAQAHRSHMDNVPRQGRDRRRIVQLSDEPD